MRQDAMTSIDPNRQYLRLELCEVIPTKPSESTVDRWMKLGVEIGGRVVVLPSTKMGGRVVVLGADLLRFFERRNNPSNILDDAEYQSAMAELRAEGVVK